MLCYSCRNEIQNKVRAQRIETCPQCHAYIHCCWNCRHFDPGKHNQCAEPQAEYQSDKGAANFCEYWEPSPRVTGSSKPDTSNESGRKAFDQLFRN